MPPSGSQHGARVNGVGRNPALDGVRGIALLVVLIHNAAWIGQTDQILSMKLALSVTATGWAGVQLFFVLSGYLITGILVDAKGREGYFRTFYFRRTLRIFPIYYAFLAIAVFVVPLLGATPEWTASVRAYQWWYLSYLSNWVSPFGYTATGLGHLWSLAVEEQFYVLWPLLVCRLDARRLGQALIAVIVLTPLLRLGLVLSGLPWAAAYEFTIARWDALGFGCLLAIMLRSPAGSQRVASVLPAAAVIAIVATIAMALWLHNLQPSPGPVLVVGQTLVSILSTTLVYNAVRPPSTRAGVGAAVHRLLRTRWLGDVGFYSYAMYLFHAPIHFYLLPHLAPLVNGVESGWRVVGLAIYLAFLLALTYAAARVSWVILERPLLRWRDRVTQRTAHAVA